jgi:site-specific DNA-methyltransferase (adenine-specific)
MNENLALQLRDNARQELMKIKDVESGVNYLNKVKAIEVWAKAEKKDAELQTMIAEQKIRTQRILGQLLKENIKHQGGRPKTVDSNDRLYNYGLTKDQSSTFQKIASIPDDTFEKEIEEKKKAVENSVKELTTTGMVMVARELEQRQRKENIKAKIKENRVEIKIQDNIKNGDCLNLLNELTDGSIDIVLTDPPYGINYASNRSIYKETITKRGIINDGNEAFELLENTCKILKMKTAENAHLYFFCSWSVFSKFESIIGKYFEVKTPIIWDKGNKGSGDLEDDWGNQTEIIIFCTKGKKLINKRKGNIISVPRLHTSKMIHPTQKPEDLIKEILEVSYVSGDLVVDPFMGSGSTIKVCNSINAKCLGIELDNEMFNIAHDYLNN